jgi:hypothetical protein
MNHAKDKDFDNIMNIVYQYRNWLGHVRTDYIRQMIMNNAKTFNFETNFTSKNKNTNLLIIENDVMISYNTYKRKNTIGTFIAQQGDCILHQIVAKEKGTGSAMLNKFFEFMNPRRVILSVRSDNEIAKKFYVKNNMKLAGETSWSKGTLPGDVFVYNQ